MKTSISAGGVVLRDKKFIVIVQEEDHKLWDLPKGKVDKDENLLKAARREIFEETGIMKLKYIKKLGKYYRFRINPDGSENKQRRKEIHIFLFTTNQEKLEPQEEDISDIKWVPIDKITDELSIKEDKNFFESIKSKITV